MPDAAAGDAKLRPPLRPWPADQVERWPLDRIKPYPQNAMKHDPDQIEQLAASMERFGVTTPVLVDEEGVLIYGHGRRLAALKLVDQGQRAFAELPVAIARGWPESDKAAYRLADNQLGRISQWDMPMLKAEARRLSLAGFDMPLLGFPNMPQLLATPATGDPNQVPVPPRAATARRGDVWILGEHRLICGDATLEATWNALMQRERAAMVFTDPPYGVSYENAAGETIEGDDKRRDDLFRMLVASFTRMAAMTVPDAGWYIWHASATRNDFSEAMTAAGLVERQYLIWAKPSIVPGHADYRWAHEPCFYASRPEHKPAFHGEPNESTVWRVELATANDTAAVIGPGIVVLDGEGNALYVHSKTPKGKTVRQVRLTGKRPTVYLAGAEGSSTVWEVARDQDYVHPTQKPVELARRAIANSSRPGEIVIDGFAGSGTTIIGAEMTGRRAFGVELDPAYCDAAIQRWQTFSGNAAVLAGGRHTHAEIARGRAEAADALV